MDDRRAERILVLLLRLGACFLFLAAFAVVMPFSLMQSIHAWLGMGQLPDAPILHYLTRSIAALYAFHGVFVWLAATDVRRYAPLILVLAWGDIIFGLTMLGIDICAGMPWYWTAGEGPSLIGYAIVVLWLLRRSRRSGFQTDQVAPVKLET